MTLGSKKKDVRTSRPGETNLCRTLARWAKQTARPRSGCGKYIMKFKLFSSYMLQSKKCLILSRKRIYCSHIFSYDGFVYTENWLKAWTHSHIWKHCTLAYLSTFCLRHSHLTWTYIYTKVNFICLREKKHIPKNTYF